MLDLPFLALGWVEALQRRRAHRVALVGFVMLVVLVAAVPGAADADANLRAIESIWEPGDGGEAPPSRVLKALAERP